MDLDKIKSRWVCHDFMTHATSKTKIGKSFDRVVCENCHDDQVLIYNSSIIKGKRICSCCAEYNEV